MTFFQGLGNFVANIFSFLNTSSIQNIIQALASLVGITVTLWIILEGYKIMAGRSDKPFQDLIWKLTSAMLFISVATNSSGFLDALKLAFEELHILMSGDISLYAKLDKLFDEVIKLANATYKATPKSIGGAFLGVVCMGLVYAGFIIGAVPTFLVIVISELTLKLLLLVLPIVIFALAFSSFKQMFSQWLNIFVSNALTILIVGLVMSAVIGTYTDFQTSLVSSASGSIEPMGISLQAFIMGLLMLGLVKTAHMMAEKLATVSLEAISSSSLKNGMNSVSNTASNVARAGPGAANTARGVGNVYQNTKGYIASKTQAGMPKPPRG